MTNGLSGMVPPWVRRMMGKLGAKVFGGLRPELTHLDPPSQQQWGRIRVEYYRLWYLEVYGKDQSTCTYIAIDEFAFISDDMKSAVS